MQNTRRFRWNSLLDCLLFLALIATINYIWFRPDPAFRSQILHPYLLPIILIGLFYGFREGLAAVLLANILYSSQLVAAGYTWSSLALQPDLRNVVTFLVVGVCFGEVGELYRRALDHLREKEAFLEESLHKKESENSGLVVANNELEEWIRFGDVQLTEIHAVADELFSFDEARILDVIAPLTQKILGADQCSLYLFDQANQQFLRHAQAGRNGVSNPLAIAQDHTPFMEIKKKPQVVSVKDVTPNNGVHFLIAVPIMAQAHLRGVLLVESMPLVRLTPYTVANLGFVSDLLNRCLDNASLVKVETEGPHVQTRFRERVQQEIHLSNRTNAELSLLYLDVADYKSYREKLGNETTRALIQQIMRRVEKAKRRCDILSYQGNGRFAVLMPQTSFHKANAFIDRAKDEISAIKIPTDKEMPLQVSFTEGTNTLLELGLKSTNN